MQIPAIGRRMIRRMPRLQVYLSQELYERVKSDRLPASELLQEAIRRELSRRALEAETDRYLTELVAEVGEPTPEQVAHGEAIAEQVGRARS